MGMVTRAIFAIAVLSGCHGSGEPARGALSAMTFNAGLSPLDVDYTAERAPYVIEAIAALDADVLCVQELWLAEDFEAVRAATEDKYETVVRSAPMPGVASCSSDELDPLAACVATSCPMLSGEELGGCAVSRCGAEVGALSSGCLDCAFTAVSSGADLTGVATACIGDGGVGFIHGGAFDVALFSSFPALETDSLVLDSYAVRASVEYARIEAPGGDVHVFCTHLASNISTFDYRGAYGDWRGEQARQIAQLLAFVDQKAGPTGRAVVLGDLNTGPEIPAAGVVGQWADHYALLVDAGFESPYAAQADVACTACADNLLRSGTTSTLIDHVLVRRMPGIAGLAQGERIFTEPVTIGGVSMHLSDHYGLRLSGP